MKILAIGVATDDIAQGQMTVTLEILVANILLQIRLCPVLQMLVLVSENMKSVLSFCSEVH